MSDLKKSEIARRHLLESAITGASVDELVDALARLLYQDELKTSQFLHHLRVVQGEDTLID